MSSGGHGYHPTPLEPVVRLPRGRRPRSCLCPLVPTVSSMAALNEGPHQRLAGFGALPPTQRRKPTRSIDEPATTRARTEPRNTTVNRERQRGTLWLSERSRCTHRASHPEGLSPATS